MLGGTVKCTLLLNIDNQDFIFFLFTFSLLAVRTGCEPYQQLAFIQWIKISISFMGYKMG